MQRMQLSRKLALVAFGSASLLSAGSALAFQTFGGATCQPFSTTTFFTYPVPKLNSAGYGISNVDTVSNLVTCPTPVTSIGTTNASWQVTVTDGTASKGFNCIGYVYDASGNLVANTPAQTTSNPFTGTTTLFLNTTSGGFSTSQQLSVWCEIPATSYVHSVSVL